MKLRVVIEQDDIDVFVADVPSRPGSLSQRTSREKALKNVREAIAGYVESVEAHGDPVPPPLPR